MRAGKHREILIFPFIHLVLLEFWAMKTCTSYCYLLMKTKENQEARRESSYTVQFDANYKIYRLLQTSVEESLIIGPNGTRWTLNLL